MVLKGYRLWVMGQLDSTCRAPPQPLGEEVGHDHLRVRAEPVLVRDLVYDAVL
jgi:hypothetical protein